MKSIGHLLDRLFHHDKWAIGLVKKLSSAQLVRGDISAPIQWIAPRFGQYIADPFLYTYKGEDYLLYELFTYLSGNGKIAIAKLMQENNGQYRLSNEQFIFDEPFHQSYPFIFLFEENIYCLPEQGESNSLRLYQATDFPSTWVYDDILIDDFPVIDPTLFRHNDRWWLFATRGNGQEDSDLYAWYSEDLHGPWQPHSQNPIKICNGKVRPAGPVFTVKKQLYRPVQVSLKRYGEGMMITKIIELSPTAFCEETVADIKPFPGYSRGLHHVCMGKNLAVVDGNRFATPPEVVMKLLGILRKKIIRGGK